MVRQLAVLIVVSIIFCVFAQDEYKASNNLKKAINRKNYEKIKSAIDELTSINTKKAAKMYIDELIDQAMKERKEFDISIYYLLMEGIKKFTSREALTYIANIVIKYKDPIPENNFSYDILDSLLEVNAEGIIDILGAVLLQGNSRHKEMVAFNFKKRRVKEVIHHLIEGLNAVKKDEQTVRKVILDVLRKITEKDCGNTFEEWKRWWDTHKDTFEIPAKEVTDKQDKPIRTAVDLRDEEEQETIKNIDKEKIVVLTASCYADESIGRKFDHNFDHIEDTLTKMEIPHIVVTREEFESDNLSMKGRIALLVNCADTRMLCHARDHYGVGGMPGARCGGICVGQGPHYPIECKLGQKGINKIKEFVKEGGYLFTEDWNIYEIIEVAFPNFIRPNVALYAAGKLEQAIVDIMPPKEAIGHPYLKGVFKKTIKKQGAQGGTTPAGGTETIPIKQRWIIDQDSPGIKVISNKVSVLIVSNDLEKRYPGFGTVAVTFAPYVDKEKERTEGTDITSGKILHVISHFSKLEKEVGENAEFTLQNLLLNFLLEAIQKHEPQKKK